MTFSPAGRPARQSYCAVCQVVVCLCILSLTAHAQAVTFPKQLKQGAVVTLQGISTTDNDPQKKIGSVVDDINQSLSDQSTNFFLDVSRILPPPDGVKVFDQEEKAADDLAGLIKDKDIPVVVGSVLQSVLNTLVQAASF